MVFIVRFIPAELQRQFPRVEKVERNRLARAAANAIRKRFVRVNRNVGDRFRHQLTGLLKNKYQRRRFWHALRQNSHKGLPLSRQKEIPDLPLMKYIHTYIHKYKEFIRQLSLIACQTTAHLLIQILCECHALKMNYSTNKVQVKYRKLFC